MAASASPTSKRSIPGKELWVTEVGVGSFGAEEVQQFGLNRTAELLLGRVPRVFWYSLFDLPRDMGSDDAAQGGGGLLLLSPFLHGPDQGGRNAQARAR